jgi:hypothetical protein
MGDHIAGLLHELERHVMANRTDRIEAIKAELKALGRKEDGTPLDDAKKSPAPKETAVDARPLETRGE